MRIKQTKIFFVFLFLGLTLASFASAALVNCGGRNPDGTTQTACRIIDLIWLIERIINFLLSWAWLVSIFYIMWAGYDMIFSAGNQEAITKAKDKFKHAIIGFVLIMCSYLLINWIVGIFSGGPSLEPGRVDFYRDLLFK